MIDILQKCCKTLSLQAKFYTYYTTIIIQSNLKLTSVSLHTTLKTDATKAKDINVSFFSVRSSVTAHGGNHLP